MWQTKWMWGLLAVAVVGMLLGTSAFAQASPVPTGQAPPQHWYYAYQNWTNRTTGNGSAALTYSVQSYVDITEQITATNTSATTVEMMGVQQVVRNLNVTACSPNCTAPRYVTVLTYRGLADRTQFLNFTTNASVLEPAGTANATAAPALGITNASAYGQQTLTERSTTTMGNRSLARTLDETSSSRYAIVFSPALGLIPWNLSKNLTWDSHSAFSAVGGWNVSYTATGSGNGRTWTHNGTSSYTVNRTGHESVYGKYHLVGPSARTGNKTIGVIGLRYRGPFNFDGGLFMTAIGSDLFAGATANWTVHAHAVYGNVSPVVSSVVAERLAPTPSSGSGGGGSTSTPPTTGGSGTSGGSAPTGGSGTGTSPVTGPVTTPVTSPGGTSPVVPPPSSSSPSPVASPSSSTPAAPSASTGPAAASGGLGALLIPLATIVLVSGAAVGVVVAARRADGGRSRP
jgi:hypothetical protein